MKRTVTVMWTAWTCPVWDQDPFRTKKLTRAGVNQEHLRTHLYWISTLSGQEPSNPQAQPALCYRTSNRIREGWRQRAGEYNHQFRGDSWSLDSGRVTSTWLGRERLTSKSSQARRRGPNPREVWLEKWKVQHALTNTFVLCLYIYIHIVGVFVFFPACAGVGGYFMSYSALFSYSPLFVCTAPKPVYSSTVYTAATPVCSSVLQLSQFTVAHCS